MPRDGAIIIADLIGKLDAPYKSGRSKAWLKVKKSENAGRDAGTGWDVLIFPIRRLPNWR